VLIVDDVEYQPQGKEVCCVRCGAPIGDTGASLGCLVVDGRAHSARHAEQPRDVAAEHAIAERPKTFYPAVLPGGLVIRTAAPAEDPAGAAVL